MNLIITGATGFLGKELIKFLKKKKKYKIKFAFRSKKKNILESDQIIVNKNNIIKSKIKLKKFNPDFVIHLATYYTPKSDLELQNKILDANLKFGSNLLELLKNKKIKLFIYTSTYTIYNSKKIYSPKNFYSVTKFLFQKILEFYSNIYNFKVVNLLLTDTYGPTDKRKKFLNYLFHSYKNNSKLNASPGFQKINLVHVKDVIECIYKIIQYQKKLKRWNNFSIYSKETLNLRKLNKIFEKLYNKDQLVNFNFFKYRKNEDLNFFPKFKKFYKWRQKIDLIAGIKGIKDSKNLK